MEAISKPPTAVDHKHTGNARLGTHSYPRANAAVGRKGALQERYSLECADVGNFELRRSRLQTETCEN